MAASYCRLTSLEHLATGRTVSWSIVYDYGRLAAPLQHVLGFDIGDDEDQAVWQPEYLTDTSATRTGASPAGRTRWLMRGISVAKRVPEASMARFNREAPEMYAL